MGFQLLPNIKTCAFHWFTIGSNKQHVSSMCFWVVLQPPSPDLRGPPLPPRGAGTAARCLSVQLDDSRSPPGGTARRAHAPS